MAAEPYTLEVTTTLPPDDGAPLSTLSYGISGTFNHRMEQKLSLPASGSFIVPFGTVPVSGAKILLLEYLISSPSDAVINLRLNGSSDNIPVSPGGALMISSPTPPGTGITALTIVHTTTGTVRVTLLA